MMSPESDLGKYSATHISFRTLIIVAVIILAAIAGFWGSPIILVLPFALLGIWLVLRFPHLGLVALVPAALATTFKINTSTQTSIHAALILIPALACVWLIHAIRRNDLPIVSSSANLPLAIFCIMATLAFIVGNLPWNYFIEHASLAAQLGGLSVFVFSALVFFLSANLIKSLRWLEMLTWLFLGQGAFYVVARLIPRLGTLFPGWIQDDATGSVFWIWLGALLWSQCLFNSRLNRIARAVCGVVAIATLAVLLLQARSWASGWVSLVIALGVIFWLRFPRLGTLLVAAGIAIVALRISDLLNIVSTDTHGTLFPLYARLAAWQSVLQATTANLLLGLGPSNYYNAVELHPILGYNIRFSSHNNYVDLIAQTGLLGLAAFFWFVATYAREAWLLRQRVQDGFAHAYINACAGGLVATLATGMLGDWFLPFIYNVGLKGFRASFLGWLFLGGMVAIKGIVERESAQSID